MISQFDVLDLIERIEKELVSHFELSNLDVESILQDITWKWVQWWSERHPKEEPSDVFHIINCELDIDSLEMAYADFQYLQTEGIEAYLGL